MLARNPNIGAEKHNALRKFTLMVPLAEVAFLGGLIRHGQIISGKRREHPATRSKET